MANMLKINTFELSLRLDRLEKIQLTRIVSAYSCRKKGKHVLSSYTNGEEIVGTYPVLKPSIIEMIDYTFVVRRNVGHSKQKVASKPFQAE